MVGLNRILYIYDFIRPLLDITILAFLIYKAYDFISKTNGVQLIKAVAIVAIAYALAALLKLNTILWLLNILAPGIVITCASDELVVLSVPLIFVLFQLPP